MKIDSTIRKVLETLEAEAKAAVVRGVRAALRDAVSTIRAEQAPAAPVKAKRPGKARRTKPVAVKATPSRGRKKRQARGEDPENPGDLLVPDPPLEGLEGRAYAALASHPRATAAELLADLHEGGLEVSRQALAHALGALRRRGFVGAVGAPPFRRWFTASAP